VVVPGRTAADAAAAAIAQLPGWLLSTEDFSLGTRLIKDGAKPRRHAVVMQCDLRSMKDEPQADTGLAFQPLPAPDDRAAWLAILPSWRAAFPPDHPDHFAGDDETAVAFLMRLFDGSELGPLHRSSTLLVDGEGRPVAGIMVNVRPAEPPWGGPWIADIWRDPCLRGTGVGPLLIGHAQRQLEQDGHVCLGLAVTAGNAARRTYEGHGFRTVIESRTVLLPEAPSTGITFPSGHSSPAPER
jgi:ribosomal protein S18 acetylase RimI-like enzyme